MLVISRSRSRAKMLRGAVFIALISGMAAGTSEDQILQDLSDAGPCQHEIKQFCIGVKSGDARLGRCIRQAVMEARNKKERRPISSTCSDDLRNLFRSLANQTVSKPVVNIVDRLRESCKDDMDRLCRSGENVVECLKEKRHELEAGCKAKLLRIRKYEVEDARLDTKLAAACFEYMKPNAICSATEIGEQLACLKKHRGSLNEECQKEAFRREQRDLEHVELIRAQIHCDAEISKHCEAPLDKTLRFKCLWSLSYGKDISEGCQKDLNNLVERASQDYRLDWGIREKCGKTIEDRCSREKTHVDHVPLNILFSNSTKASGVGAVLACLRRNAGHITDDDCKAELGRIIGVESVMFGANPETRKACKDDVGRFCPGVNRREIHQCLRKHMKDLSSECAEKEAEQVNLEGDDLIRNPLLMQPCKRALAKYCDDIKPGAGRRRKCLESNMNADDFPTRCFDALQADTELSNTDWRLKYGISNYCKSDMEHLCSTEKQIGGGVAIRCLVKHVEEIVDKGCSHEVTAYLRQTAQNATGDQVSFHACAKDVEKFCPKVLPGEGRIRECLMQNKRDLSRECAKAADELESIFARDVTLDPRAWEACKASAKILCPEIRPGNGNLWHCLEEKVLEDSMEPPCRKHVNQHTKRMHAEFRLDIRLSEFCAEASQTFCRNELEDSKVNGFARNSDVIGCLLEHVVDIQQPRCAKSLKLLAKQRVENYQLDPQANLTCHGDIEAYCSLAKTGGHTKVQNCLEGNLTRLSQPCKLFMHKMIALRTQNLDFNRDLSKSCSSSVVKFCQGTAEGIGRRVGCLISHMREPEMDSACKKELIKELHLRSKSLNVNPSLRMACAKDLDAFTAADKCDLQAKSWRINCLTDHVSELKSGACRQEVENLIANQRFDLRAKPGMMQACALDCSHLCPGIVDGEGRLENCLSQRLNEIKDETCKKMVVTLEKADGQNASLIINVRQACEHEQETFCKGVGSDGGKLMTCLAYHMNDVGFSKTCHEKVDVDVATAFKKHTGHEIMQELTEFLQMKKAFCDKWGYVFMTGTAGFFVMLGFALSYCVIQRKFYGAGYGVVVPKDLES